MKKFFTLCLLIQFSGLAGQQTFCATDSIILSRAGNDRALREEMIQRRRALMAGNDAQEQKSAPTYTIPVVVHILHRGQVENLSDYQVQVALDNLNKDFNKLNADTASVVPAYQPLIADAQIHFQLATIDQYGHCTNGIIRYFTEEQWFGIPLDFKYTWPTDRYMNIYVVRAFSSPWMSGYSSMPSFPVPPMEDAIVMLWASFMTADNLTHEVGHWLDLQHTWGMGNPGSCGDDGIADTPPTKGFFNCNLNNAAVCTPTIIENVQNFMDYACRQMFTPGQVQRMHSTLTSTVAWRNSLSTYQNHMMTGITNTASFCIPKVDISPYDTIIRCKGTVVTVHSYTSNIAASSYSWTADNGATLSGAGTAIATLTVNNSGYTHVTCTALNSNGGATQTLVIFAPAYNVHPPSIIESFESPALPTDWSAAATGTVGWQPFPGAASHGTVSMYVAGELLGPGEETWLETPSYNLAADPTAHFTFRYAYARYNSSHNDLFKVMASTDCGETWNDIYVPSLTQLASGSGGVSSTPLVPQPSEWKLYDLGAHPNYTKLRSSGNVRFRFYFRQDPAASGGNRFFLDQINLFSVVSSPEQSWGMKPQLFPTPNDGDFTVRFSVPESQKVYYSVTSIDGRTIVSGDLGTFSRGQHETALTHNQDLPAGVYLLELKTASSRGLTRMVVTR